MSNSSSRTGSDGDRADAGSSGGSSKVEDRVRSLIAPILDDLDVELFDVEHNGGRLMITVDTDEGIDSGTLHLVTRTVSRELDETDPVPGSYTLEVSSPGLERKLRRPVHWQKSIGLDVTVKVHPSFDSERRINGVLVAADDTTATVRVAGDAPAQRQDDGADDDEGGADRVIPYDVVQRARTVFEWGPAPKPTGGGPKKPHPKSAQNSRDNAKKAGTS